MLEIINQALNPDFSAVSEQITETLWGSTSLSMKGGSWIKIVLKAHMWHYKVCTKLHTKGKEKKEHFKELQKNPILEISDPH